jgi:hypothetical protein
MVLVRMMKKTILPCMFHGLTENARNRYLILYGTLNETLQKQEILVLETNVTTLVGNS